MDVVEINGDPVIWRNHSFVVTEWQARYYLYRVKETSLVAELINGPLTLRNRFDGEFENWILAMNQRDMRRVDKINEQIDTLNGEQRKLIARWADTAG